MRCTLCSGIRVVLVETKHGYSVYKQCPACKGHGTLPPRPSEDLDD